jgi:hypothetical protein
VVSFSVVLNGGSLLSYGSDWAKRSACDRNVLSLLAGSPQTAGVGWERVGLGLQMAEASRYVYMAAMLLTPAFALAVDRLAALAPAALTAGRLVLAGSALLNIGSLLSYGSDWAARAACDRHVLSLLAGSPALVATFDDGDQPLQFSPDVRLIDIARMVRDEAIVPIVPTTPTDLALVQQALDPTLRACPAPV